MKLFSAKLWSIGSGGSRQPQRSDPAEAVEYSQNDWYDNIDIEYSTWWIGILNLNRYWMMLTLFEIEIEIGIDIGIDTDIDIDMYSIV